MMTQSAQSPLDLSRSKYGGRILREVVVGVAASAIAVLARALLPLDPEILPTFTVVIAICFATVLAGFWAGATTMIVGGVLTWRFILPRSSWALNGRSALILLGYFT